jgi:hypothetical protein
LAFFWEKGEKAGKNTFPCSGLSAPFSKNRHGKIVRFSQQQSAVTEINYLLTTLKTTLKDAYKYILTRQAK